MNIYLNRWKAFILLLATAPMNHAMSGNPPSETIKKVDNSHQISEGHFAGVDRVGDKAGYKRVPESSDSDDYFAVVDNNNITYQRIPIPTNEAIQQQVVDTQQQLAPKSSDNDDSFISADDLFSDEESQGLLNNIDGFIKLYRQEPNIEDLDAASTEMHQQINALKENIQNGSDGIFRRGSSTHRQNAKENATELNQLIESEKDKNRLYLEKSDLKSLIEDLEEKIDDQKNELNVLYNEISYFDLLSNFWQSPAGQKYQKAQRHLNKLEQNLSKKKSELDKVEASVKRHAEFIAEAEKELHNYQKTLKTWK